MSEDFTSDSIDLGWFRRVLVEDVLPHWLAHAVTDEGLFLTQLDRRWNRYGPDRGSIITRGRLLYTLSKGYELTGDQRYRRAVEKGAEFLRDKFRDRECGGWFLACDRRPRSLVSCAGARPDGGIDWRGRWLWFASPPRPSGQGCP